LLSSHPVRNLGFDMDSLEHEFEKWQRERTAESRKAFDEMLAENSFVEFWGRLSKIGGEGVDGGVKADDPEEDEGEGGGGKVDMKALARNVDVEEMEKVLKAGISPHIAKDFSLIMLCRMTRDIWHLITFLANENGGYGCAVKSWTSFFYF
jgi:hypothetical protein